MVILREALPIGSRAVPKSSWNRGVEAQTLFSLLPFALLRCATCLSWRAWRDVQALLIKLVRCDKFTELAASKPTPHIGLFAILQVRNDVRNVDHVVIFECVFGGSQFYVMCCGRGAHNDLTEQSCG